MKSIFANVIQRGGYDLAGLLKQIDRYHVEGKLTDAEREELYALARKEPKAQIDCTAEIHKLWDAVHQLQAASKEDAGSAEEFPVYVQPTGAHDAYRVGDTVTYNGRKYRCIMDNCVWSPDVLPSAWEEIVDV